MDSETTDPPLLWPRRLSAMLEGSWAKGWSKRPSLESGAIVDAARAPDGTPVDGPWFDRLDRLCRALREEAQLNALGRTIAYGQLVRIVASRARAERLWLDHPEILERPLPRAVAIVGPMRSGTTRIHRLLACDPDFACTRLFETLEPVPPRGLIDLRPAKAVFGRMVMQFCNPSLKAVHPTWAWAPEEEAGFHAFSIWGPQFEAQWWVPSFAASVERENTADAYREFGRLLQTAAWARRLPPERCRLLKSPQFSEDLVALRRLLPDVAVIRLTRPLEEVVASSASLAWQYARIQSDKADRCAFGQHWLNKTVRRECSLEDSLASEPALVTLDYHAVTADWRGTMHRIYSALGRRLRPDVERRMQRFVARSTDHQAHRYRLHEFGLDADRVSQALARRRTATT